MLFTLHERDHCTQMRPEFQSSGTEKVTEFPAGASQPVGCDGVDVPAPVKN